MATHGQDNFAICTAPMDDDVEAIFILDDVTGDLKAACLNIQMRRFNTFFKYNVLRDLPHRRASEATTASSAAWPAFARMWPRADGALRGLRGRGLDRPNRRLRRALGAGPGRRLVPYKGTLVPLDSWQFRDVAIRNP